MPLMPQATVVNSSNAADLLWSLFPGDKPPASPSQWDDEFGDGSLDPKWSWRNQTTATYVESQGYSLFTPAIQNSHSINGLEQVAPTGDFTLSTKMSFIPPDIGSTNVGGLYLGNNSNGKLVCFGIYSAAGTAPTMIAFRMTNSTSFSASIVTDANLVPTGFRYLRLVMSTTTIGFRVSNDGISWDYGFNTTNETIAAFIGSVRSDVDRIGFFGDLFNNSAVPMPITPYWFRVTEP